jgi:LmbE family N-acetylglucosaminyl deacetylase
MPGAYADGVVGDSRALAVLSPHLDDAVLSIGAFLGRAARQGCDVVVVTVLANDPAADEAAGAWDAACGFDSAAAAARARRDEDSRACASLGARTHWLPYGDETYERGGSDDQIWQGIREAVGEADVVFVPGYPLRHRDHRWLAELVVARRAELGGALRFYADQPYAAGRLLRARAALPPDSAAGDLRVSWRRVHAALPDRWAKIRAITQYHSQLRQLGVAKLAAVQMEELLRRGELIGWP